MKYQGKKLTLTQHLSRHLKVPSGCWEWQLSLDTHGYGQHNTRFKKEYGKSMPHQLSYIMYKGKIPKGMLVCHTCDNRRCINPEHLFLGTVQDNSIDASKKGRLRPAKGEDSTSAKLTEENVRAIRNSDESLSKLAKKFGICFQQISRIKRKERWAHVD